MAKVDFDATAFELIRAAAVDGSAAFALLAHAADKLRKGEAFDPALADFIANAFERTARTMNSAELASSLLLRVRHRRPGADWIKVALRVDELSQSMALGKAQIAAAKEFDIDSRSVRRYWVVYQEARAIED